jgi:lincosamide nucleotidyltransferase A/C/D/E
MMRARDVLQVVDRLDAAGVRAWLDGGWGVDALVGDQTREHDDLDLVVALTDATAAQAALAAVGFALAEDERPTRFVVRDAADRRVDFHTIEFDETGDGVQRLQDGRSWRYPREGFSGSGRIGGRVVRCLTAEAQVLCHLGYDPDDTDRHDMALLAERCGVAPPAPYGS